MSKHLLVLCFAVIVALLTGQSSAQRATASLNATAARDGYTMRQLLPTRSVELFRPGLAIVLRPGAVMALMSAADAQQPATGAISIDVHPVPGSEAVLVTGHAPSSAPVTITLLATISSDLPTVVVSRHETQPDANGNFQATISIAPNYVRDTYLRVLATSAAGSTPASAQITVGAPNAGQTVPLEYQPQGP